MIGSGVTRNEDMSPLLGYTKMCISMEVHLHLCCLGCIVYSPPIEILLSVSPLLYCQGVSSSRTPCDLIWSTHANICAIVCEILMACQTARPACTSSCQPRSNLTEPLHNKERNTVSRTTLQEAEEPNMAVLNQSQCWNLTSTWDD